MGNSSDAKDDGGQQISFALVPDVCWALVSSFAAPPDVYNLALSSKHFHRSNSAVTATTVGSKVMTCNIKSMPELNGRSGTVMDAAAEKEQVSSGRIPVLVAGMRKPIALKPSCVTSPLLATTLLRQSLLSSLGRVLDQSKSGITLKSVLKLPEGALIAGSTIAQACLGAIWLSHDEASDVDVFCSAKAAPMVRSWLVEANAMFGGFHDTYLDVADERLLYTVDTKIHHVEKWGSIFENTIVNKHSGDLEGIDEYGYGYKTVAEANKDGAGIDIETLKNTEYYKDAVKWGKNCQKEYVHLKWKHGYFDELGVDQSSAYNIKPKPGGDLPFDFHGDGSIDLIVGSTWKKGVGEVTPFELLDDFDLTICKASFDGKTFRVPDPHRTFSAQSTMEPNRRAVVESYVKHFQPPGKKYLDPIAQSALASATIAKVQKDVPNAPFYRQIDVAARLPDKSGKGLFGIFEVDEAKHGPSIQFHNWTYKLILRLRKYQQRGVDVIGAPTIDDDFDIDEFYIQIHGG